MELCTYRGISKLPYHKLLSSRNSQSPFLKKTSISYKRPGSLYSSSTPLLRASISRETSASINKQSGEVITIEGNQADEQEVPYESVTVEEVPKEEAPMGEQFQVFEFLNNLNIKLESENSSSVLLYGSGALVTLWLVSAIVGAIDSIPLIPSVMEIVGLSFTIWFTSRYLIFKENRDELFAKIEELKEEVIGLDDY